MGVTRVLDLRCNCSGFFIFFSAALWFECVHIRRIEGKKVTHSLTPFTPLHFVPLHSVPLCSVSLTGSFACWKVAMYEREPHSIFDRLKPQWPVFTPCGIICRYGGTFPRVSGASEGASEAQRSISE